jgi:C_GCAxxG_C_C family probable redox protein
VLTGFGRQWGLERETALKLARAFGVGMGAGHTCGAVTGALMVMGLAAGEVVENDRAARYACYEKARSFMAAFRDLHGSTDCRDLLGLDPATPAGMAEARERNLFTILCPEMVKTACELLEEVL